jgi:hypothetical protein
MIRLADDPFCPAYARYEHFLHECSRRAFYVGMGTVSSFLGHKLLTTIVSAVAGRRTLFFLGWSRGSRALTQLIQPPRG